MAGKNGEINFNPYTANMLDYVGKRLVWLKLTDFMYKY